MTPQRKPLFAVAFDGIPKALHRGESELPFVEFESGVEMQVLHTDLDTGLWVIRMRLAPGAQLPTHKHAGEVFAFTLAGAWKYLEYPEVNTAGSYLYEPAGSVHTLQALPSNTEKTDVWFAIRGPNLNLDAEGKVTLVLDAGLVLKVYRSRCRELGMASPTVIGS